MPYKDKETEKQYHRDYYKKNKDKIKEKAKQHYAKDTAHHRKLNKQWLSQHFEWQLWNRAKGSAKTRGLTFDITPEDIIIPESCPYLGIKLTTISDGGRQDTNASLDRIDNTKGYTKGNIQVISSKANYMKRNATIEELRAFAKGVLALHGE